MVIGHRGLLHKPRSWSRGSRRFRIIKKNGNYLLFNLEEMMFAPMAVDQIRLKPVQKLTQRT